MSAALLPGGVSAYGLIPFAVIFLLSLLCSVLFMRYYWKSQERDRPAAVIVTLGLWIALLTSFLLPLDVFLVSMMKDKNGDFKSWAQNSTRKDIEKGMTYGYYTVYSLVLFFAFFLLPLVYFAHEEQDEEFPSPRRFCSALKYTLVLTVACAVLFVIGAFIPYKVDVIGWKTNSTDWEVVKQLISRMYADKFTAALSFVLNCLMLIGMIILVIYAGFGVAAFPVLCLRGYTSLQLEEQVIRDRKIYVDENIRRLQARENTLTSRERSTLADLEEEQRLNALREAEVNRASRSVFHKCRFIFRGVAMVVGVAGAVTGFFVWLSLLLANTDRLMHSLGYRMGYLVAKQTLPNPLDYVMVETQEVFPVDYVIYFGLVVFLVSCTIAGVRYLGVWCFCIKLFKIRPHRTQPQALILLCTILIYTVLALNVFMYAVIPQYTAFGSQHYHELVNESESDNAFTVSPCNNRAPKDDCVMTRASEFLLEFTLKVWIFGAAYYWLTWAFLLVVLISFFGVMITRKRSAIAEAVDKDDFEESDSEVRPLTT